MSSNWRAGLYLNRRPGCFWKHRPQARTTPRIVLQVAPHPCSLLHDAGRLQ